MPWGGGSGKRDDGRTERAQIVCAFVSPVKSAC
jgi:hypothetical protein